MDATDDVMARIEARIAEGKAKFKMTDAQAAIIERLRKSSTSERCPGTLEVEPVGVGKGCFVTLRGGYYGRALWKVGPRGACKRLT